MKKNTQSTFEEKLSPKKNFIKVNKVFTSAQVLQKERSSLDEKLNPVTHTKQGKGSLQKKINRIFHDIVQNSFDTYPPYLIMT